MSILVLALAFFLLPVQDPVPQEVRDLVEKLRSDGIDAREEGIRRLVLSRPELTSLTGRKRLKLVLM